ncbi:MAG: hypothetical protein LUG19_09770, partial [Desulfovibrio sp.]|nr:hypothetical protein [Desulfovibrio sp.]
MADITLARPQAGQHTVLDSAPDSRLVLRFPTDQATMERSGDNLVFSFDDGSSIELANFYTQYSQASMPDFEVDGTLVAGADFFNAFGPDLMPAAGPAAGAAARAARYNEFGNSDLLDGINHLNELDWGMGLDNPATENVNALGTLGGESAPAVAVGGVTPPPVPPASGPDQEPSLDVSIDLAPIVIGDDNTLNKAEFDSNVEVKLTGTVGGDAKAGDTVKLTLPDGSTVNTPVIQLPDGSLGFETTTDASKFASGSEVKAEITITDGVGHIAHDDDTEGYGVDTTAPSVKVEITTDADNNGVISKDELGDSDEIKAHVTLNKGTEVGDTLVVTDQNNNELFKGTVTPEMLDKGLDVILTAPKDGQVQVNATVTDPAGNSDEDSDAAHLTDQPSAIYIGSDSKTVDEEVVELRTTSGVIDVELAGAGTITVGNIPPFEVPAAGAFSRTETIESPGKGTLNLTVSRDENGKLTIQYEYAIAKGGAEHDNPDLGTKEDKELLDSFDLSVSDGVNTVWGSLKITIVDDEPTLAL